MSSTQSGYSQGASRGKFLLAIGAGDTKVYTVTAVNDAINATINLGVAVSQVGNVISCNTFADIAALAQSLDVFSSDVPSGTLLKDLGSELIFSFGNGTIIQKMRLVQRVSGPTTEGVPPAYPTTDTFYVNTFNAGPGTDFLGVTVVRVG